MSAVLAVRKRARSPGCQSLADMMAEIDGPRPRPQFKSESEVRAALRGLGLTPVAVNRSTDLFTGRPTFIVTVAGVTWLDEVNSFDRPHYTGPKARIMTEAARVLAGSNIIFDTPAECRRKEVTE